MQLATGESNNQGAYLGATLRQDNDRLIVASVPKQTPAYEQGLNANDQIIAVDGNRASQTSLASYLGEKRPNDKIKLTVFRFDELREIEITLGGRAAQNFQIVPLENPNDDQKRLYKQYFGTELN